MTIGKLRLRLLVALLLGFAILGSTISILFVRHFEATFGLPGTIEAFKDAEPMLRSAQTLSVFAKSRGIADLPLVQRFETQLSRGLTSPVRIVQQFSVDRLSCAIYPMKQCGACLRRRMPPTSLSQRPKKRPKEPQG